MSSEYNLCSRTAQRKLFGAACRLKSLFKPLSDWFSVPRFPHSIRNSLCALLLCLMTGAVQADGLRVTPDMVSDALEGQGYTVQSVTRTLLGRARIVAQQGRVWREVVLDLSSGQILRDYAVEFSPNELPDRQTQAMPRGGRVLGADDLPMLEN